MQRGSKNTKNVSKYAINIKFRKGNCINMKEKLKVEIKDKLNLTVEEAAAYSNIGICKLNEILKKPNCPFVLYIGRKKLIKRKEFEKYLATAIEL